MKKIGIFALILLAGYGALVTYFDVAEGKERSKVVLNLEDLDLDLDSPVGEKLEDSLNLEESQGSTDANKADPSDKVASLEGSSDLTSTEDGTSGKESSSEKKATFSGDLESLDLSKEGMKNALPEGIDASQVWKTQVGEESSVSGVEVNCEKHRNQMISYIQNSHLSFPDEPIFTKINRLRKKGRKEKARSYLSQLENELKKLAEVEPPPEFELYHLLKMSFFQKQLLAELKEIANASPNTPLEEIYTDSDQETHAFVFALLQRRFEYLCNKCSLGPKCNFEL